MTSAFEIGNEAADALEVWVEPWCHPYFVPRGSTLRLTYDAGAEALATELTAERLVVWPNSEREPDAELDGRRVLPDFGEPHAATERPPARPIVGGSRSRRPPPAVLAVGAAFILLVPVWQAVQMGVRDWSYGGSPAADFDAPYVWGVAMLRTVGAVLLGLLVLAVRRRAVPWVAIVSVWLAGPPLSFLSVGILHLSASAGQRSIPDDWSFAWIWFVFPLLVTAGLLGSRRGRDYYRC